MVSDSFSSKILTRLDGELRTKVAIILAEDGQTTALWKRAHTSHPTLSVSAEVFAGHLSSLLQRGLILPDSLLAAQIEDLYLAAGCADNDAEALRIFEVEIIEKIPGALLRIQATGAEVDEALQALRNLLFVAAGNKSAKIHSYAGAGRLYSWTRVTAIRLLHNIRRESRSRHEVVIESSELWEGLLPAGDAELEHLKATHRDKFHKALSGAVDSLGDRQKLLLKQYVVDGLSSEVLARLYKVHRATASRWVVSAQEDLLSATRKELMVSLELGADELASFLRVIQSRFDTGLSDLLSD